jgi:hypothetical protein
MPEKRWRVRKSTFRRGQWLVYKRTTTTPGRVIRGSARYFRSWAAAMGYANLHAWMDRGGNPPPPVEYSEAE